MARSPYFIGLDIGSNTIRLVALTKTDGPGLAVVGATERSTEGMRRGAVVSPDVVAKNIQRSFHDLKKNFGVIEDHACVSVGEPRMTTYISKGAVSVSRADGEITKEDAARAAEAAEAALPRLGNREVVHSFPLFFSVDRDTHIREPVGLSGIKLEAEVLFVAAFTPHVKNIIKAMDMASIAIDDIVAAPYAASFNTLSRKQKEVGSMILDIGSQTSTFAVFEEGLLTSLEVIPVGSGHITYDISLGFQIDLASAERVKRNVGAFLEQGKKEIRLSDFPKSFENTFSPRKLRDIVEARLGDIFELANKQLKKIERAELLPGGVIIVGGGAHLDEVDEAARRELRLPVEIGISTPGLVGKKELIEGPEWATAAGLARYAAEQHEPPSRMGELFSSPFSKRIAKIFKAFIP